MDVDGVLSDGRIIIDANGIESKAFDAHDGYGIARARENGILLAIITGRHSEAVTVRAGRLKIEEVYQNHFDKLSAYEKLKAKYSLNDDEVCFIGDDEFDLPLLRLVGVSAAPPNAIPVVKQQVHYITTREGGRGAVRELLDKILQAQGLI